MSTVLAIAKRLDRLEGRFRPPPARTPSAVELAERAGFVPDPWQRDVLISTADRLLLNCSRQSGKTSVVALLAVHEAISRPGSLTLMVAPTQRQAAELLRTARQFYARSGGPELVDTDAESVLSVTLRNGSRLLALPGKEANVRGFAAVGLLLIDEAARVSDELYVSVRPMIAVSGGRLIALSTPWGKRGWWHTAWSDGADWERYEIPATLCPRIPDSFLDQERRSMGEHIFASEYLCQFVETEDQVFAFADIAAAMSSDIAPLFGEDHAA